MILFFGVIFGVETQLLPPGETGRTLHYSRHCHHHYHHRGIRYPRYPRWFKRSRGVLEVYPIAAVAVFTFFRRETVGFGIIFLLLLFAAVVPSLDFEKNGVEGDVLFPCMAVVV